MKGHVTQQGSVWYAVIETYGDVRNRKTGKIEPGRKRKWHKLPDCKGKRDAEAACRKLVTAMEGGA